MWARWTLPPPSGTCRLAGGLRGEGDDQETVVVNASSVVGDLFELADRRRWSASKMRSSTVRQKSLTSSRSSSSKKGTKPGGRVT